MARLLLGNVPAATTEDQIGEFLVKYGFPPYDAIEMQPGDGSNPVYLLTFNGLDAAEMFKLQGRVHQMFWKDRKVTARIMQDRFA